MENDREPLLEADTIIAAAQRYIHRGCPVIWAYALVIYPAASIN